MDILHIVQGYAPARGGSEYRVQRVSELLVNRHGDRVTVLCPDGCCCDDFNLPQRERLPCGVEVINGVRVERLRTWRGGTRWLDRAIAFCGDGMTGAHLRYVRFGPRMPALLPRLLHGCHDIVMATTFPCLQMPAAAWLAPLTGTPLVLVGAYHDREPLHRHPYTWRFTRRAAAYVAHTPFERECAVRNGVAADCVHLIAAGADPGWTDGVDRSAARTRWRLDGTVFLYAGQFIPGKGLPLILDAFARCVAAGTDCHLLLAGSTRSPYAAEVHAAAERLPATARARLTLVPDFPGEDKAQLYAAADVFLYPTVTDSFGIAALDAWAAGLPVVFAEAPPQRDLAGADGNAARFVPPDDAAALATIMQELAGDDAQRARLGRAGRELVTARHTWVHVADAYRALYAELVAQRRAGRN